CGRHDPPRPRLEANPDPRLQGHARHDPGETPAVPLESLQYDVGGGRVRADRERGRTIQPPAPPAARVVQAQPAQEIGPGLRAVALTGANAIEEEIGEPRPRARSRRVEEHGRLEGAAGTFARHLAALLQSPRLAPELLRA